MLAWSRKRFSRLQYSPHLILAKKTAVKRKQSSIHIAWVDTALLRALTKVLSDPYSFLCVFSLLFSYIFGAKLLQSDGTAAGSHTLHSPHPPPFVFLRSYPYSSPVLSFMLKAHSALFFSSHTQTVKSTLIASASPVLCPQVETFQNYKKYRGNPHCREAHIWMMATQR